MACGGKKSIIETGRLSASLICPICLTFFRKPKLLPCSHSICKVCLEQHVNNASTGGCFPCPICCQQTQLPSDGVQRFKDNYFITRLQDELKAFPNFPSCDICAENDVTVRATSKCRECCDCLCSKCSKAHARTRYTNDHHIISLDGDSPQTIPSNAISLKCDEHKNELVSNFCVPCQRLVCRDCKALHHEGHKTITFRDAIVGKWEELGQEVSTLGNKASAVNSSYQRLLDTMENEQKHRDKTLNDIVRKRDHLIQRIRQAANAAEERVNTVSAITLRMRETELENVNFQAAQIKSQKEYVELLMTKASDVEVLDNFIIVKNRSSTLMSEHISMENSPIMTLEHTYSKTMDVEIVNQFSLIETNVVLVEENKLETPIRTQVLSTNQGLRLPEVYQVEITKEGQIDKPIQRGYVSGISRTNDTVFVCQDNHVYMKDIESWADVSEVYRTYGGVYDVSVDSNSIVVSKKVTCTDKKVQLVVGDLSLRSHTATHSLPFTSHCPFVVRGPSVGELPTYYVSEYNSPGNPAVHRVDSNGTILQTYGKGILNSPYGIAADIHGDLVVSEYGLDDVLIFNRDGSVKRRLRQHNHLSTEQLSVACGICVDEDGYIFVSSFNTASVLLFSSAGDYIQTLLTWEDGLDLPTKLSVSPDGRLSVANYGGRILVFKYTIRV